MFRPNGEVDIDELTELVDINLNDFEHSITFGNRPLFTPPVYVDTAGSKADTSSTHGPCVAGRSASGLPRFPSQPASASDRWLSTSEKAR